MNKLVSSNYQNDFKLWGKKIAEYEQIILRKTSAWSILSSYNIIFPELIFISFTRHPMKQWTTLIGYSLVTFTNALGFGIFTNNLEAYSLYYNVK